jgi:hypothetical protein
MEFRYGRDFLHPSRPALGLAKDLPLREIEQLMYIAADRNLKDTLEPTNVFEFWSLLASEHPEIANRAEHPLQHFVATYCCGAALSKQAVTNIKHRSSLDAEADMLVQLSSFKPDFVKLIHGKQTDPSH